MRIRPLVLIAAIGAASTIPAVSVTGQGARAAAGGGMTLDITLRGAGSTGTIKSDPAGLSCSKKGKQMMRCHGTFARGPVALVAIPPADAVFLSYTGGGCKADSACTVNLTANTSMTASFGLPALALRIEGVGHGKVTSKPEGLYCVRGSEQSCSKTFPRGTEVTLTAVPDFRNRLTAWGGACSGDKPSCTVTVGKPSFVSAAFNPQ